ncbi:hypothetical protein [Burkholderia anthina]|uniref:hypothetical protein n=1 Tax=Burkholderia anthina TaxID=179879 RepID=UPI001AA0414D|nr:hypothetical protein [Burkholderia anthina]QTD95695.1 hypothetical protein J4G50_38975 [Burkholderia anthina]QTD95696.1 hypothetical protein J4G50_39105 [Burkholderia anthina]
MRPAIRFLPRARAGHEFSSDRHALHPLVLTIIRKALREAAMAPTYVDALDITGEALRHIADMTVHAEVSR